MREIAKKVLLSRYVILFVPLSIFERFFLSEGGFVECLEIQSTEGEEVENLLALVRTLNATSKVADKVIIQMSQMIHDLQKPLGL